ncbi:MAG: phosphatase PAP2 family protein [Flavobacteriaceae bacterium]|nr:phosphatase PAP2 family protein [Flavobacteriaceae bacterium]
MIKKCKLLLYFFILLVSLSTNNLLSQVSDIGTHEDWEYALEGTGDVLQLALPLSAGITTVIKKDWKGTKQWALSYGTAIIVTHSLKRIVKKQRPEGRNRFDAFPSGHTASAFSGASFIQRRYGWKYGKWAYVLASIVGVSRMEGPDGWHDIWDVLAGASIGIGSTYIFTSPYKKTTLKLVFLQEIKII